MKRSLCILLSAVLLLLLCTGCGSKTVDSTPSNIDIDLTQMSSTMIYSEVSNIMQTPDKYIGKTIRAKGPFTMYHDTANDNYFFAVLINDATACCQQGLEFVWSGDHDYPTDYPELNTEIVVCGTFVDYMDGNQQYYHLDNASMSVA